MSEQHVSVTMPDEKTKESALLALAQELQDLILGCVVNIDPKAAFTTRLTSRQWYDATRYFITHSLKNHSNKLWDLQWRICGNMLDCYATGIPSFKFSSYGPRIYPPNPPWRHFPSREPQFLRPDASWRYIPLVSPSGKVIHSLQVVTIKGLRFDTTLEADISKVDFPRIQAPPDESKAFGKDEMPGKEVSWGHLFDLLSVCSAQFGRPLGGWTVLFNSRVHNVANLKSFISCLSPTRTDENSVRAYLENVEDSSTLWLWVKSPNEAYNVENDAMWDHAWHYDCLDNINRPRLEPFN